MAEKQRLRSARSIERAAVFDLSGARVGRINRLLFDAVTWRVRVALIGFDLPGTRREAIPIPCRALQYNAAADRFFTSVTRLQLSTAPAYDEAALEGPDWEDRLLAHYNVRNDLRGE
jgi:hypothetical protein